MQDRRKELQDRLNEKAAAFSHLFKTPNGQVVLEALEQEFEPTQIFDPNPHITSYNAGRRDVVQYIKQLMRLNDANTETTI